MAMAATSVIPCHVSVYCVTLWLDAGHRIGHAVELLPLLFEDVQQRIRAVQPTRLGSPTYARWRAMRQRGVALCNESPRHFEF